MYATCVGYGAVGKLINFTVNSYILMMSIKFTSSIPQ